MDKLPLELVLLIVNHLTLGETLNLSHINRKFYNRYMPKMLEQSWKNTLYTHIPSYFTLVKTSYIHKLQYMFHTEVQMGSLTGIQNVLALIKDINTFIVFDNADLWILVHIILITDYFLLKYTPQFMLKDQIVINVLKDIITNSEINHNVCNAYLVLKTMRPILCYMMQSFLCETLTTYMLLAEEGDSPFENMTQIRHIINMGALSDYVTVRGKASDILERMIESGTHPSFTNYISHLFEISQRENRQYTRLIEM